MFGIPSTSLRSGMVQQQPAVRQQGFGNHFKDSPPSYIEETKADNKIERVKKPKPKIKKKKVKKQKIEDYKN